MTTLNPELSLAPFVRSRTGGRVSPQAVVAPGRLTVAGAQIRSAVPGRTRWDVPGLLGQRERAAYVTRVLQAYPGVVSASASATTGRVLVTHAPGVDLQALKQAIDFARLQPVPVASAAPAASPVSAAAQPLMQLLARGAPHRELAQKAAGAAFLNRLLDSGPTMMISTAIDVVTRGPASWLGKLGFATARTQLFALGGIGMAMWALNAYLNYLYTTYASELSNAIQFDLLSDAYENLQRQDIAYIEGKPVSEWMSELESDIAKVGEFIESGIDPIVTMAANGAIVGVTFLSLSRSLSAVQLLMVPGLYYVSSKLLPPVRGRQGVWREAVNERAAILHNNIVGMPTIISAAREDDEAERINKAGQKVIKDKQHLVALSATYVPAVQMVVGARFMTTLVAGGLMVLSGNLAPSSFSLMAYSSLRLDAALGRLGLSLEAYQQTSISLYRVLRLLERQPAIVSGITELPLYRVSGEIAFHDVTFGYTPDRPVLNGLSLIFPAGKTTGIVGSTGAGKSTILKLIQRFYDVDGGSITLDGIDIRDLRLDDLRRAIADVPQRMFLTAGTVRSNIAYKRPDAGLDEVIAAARAAAASEFVEKLPDGYDTLIGEGGPNLSAGQQQRLIIARAILANAPILQFDEATSALDPETEAAIQRSLSDVTIDRTTIIVAHRLSTVRNADNIYVLEDGQVCEQGSHEELIRANGVYASMWRVQTGEPVRHPEAESNTAQSPDVEETPNPEVRADEPGDVPATPVNDDAAPASPKSRRVRRSRAGRFESASAAAVGAPTDEAARPEPLPDVPEMLSEPVTSQEASATAVDVSEAASPETAPATRKPRARKKNAAAEPVAPEPVKPARRPGSPRRKRSESTAAESSAQADIQPDAEPSRPEPEAARPDAAPRENLAQANAGAGEEAVQPESQPAAGSGQAEPVDDAINYTEPEPAAPDDEGGSDEPISGLPPSP